MNIQTKLDVLIEIKKAILYSKKTYYFVGDYTVQTHPNCNMHPLRLPAPMYIFMFISVWQSISIHQIPVYVSVARTLFSACR